jgi:hypothetical protein
VERAERERASSLARRGLVQCWLQLLLSAQPARCPEARPNGKSECMREWLEARAKARRTRSQVQMQMQMQMPWENCGVSKGMGSTSARRSHSQVTQALRELLLMSGFAACFKPPATYPILIRGPAAMRWKGDTHSHTA